MSIILQHEFWDLVVTQDAFEVSLNFSRKPERLTVPFDAITGFTDPSVPFGFKLEPRVPEEPPQMPPAPAPSPGDAEPNFPPAPAMKPETCAGRRRGQGRAAGKGSGGPGLRPRSCRSTRFARNRRSRGRTMGDLVNLRQARKRRERERDDARRHKIAPLSA